MRKPHIALIVCAALALGQTPVATITSLTPNNAPQGSPATPLTVNGQNLATGSTIQWTTVNGTKVSLAAQLVQSAQLAATIPAALLTTAGTAQVAVANPAGVLTNQLPFNISIGSIAVSVVPLSNGTPGATYGPVTLAATGGTGSYTWLQSGGSFPPGLGLDSTGVISGNPTGPGVFSFSVRVTDSAGAKATGTFAITVTPTPLKITSPATLASGIAGFEYPAQVLSASGGTPPYTFGVTGTLPAGLTFSNGSISGTPTIAGSSSFTLTVSDSGNPVQSATSAKQIVIRPATTDLVPGGSSAAFTLAAGSTALPSPIVIPVSSSTTTTPITYATAVNPSVSWLSATSGSTTPGSVSIALTSQASSLSASGSPYQTSVVLTCATGNSCAGNSQTIAVSLTVTSPSPQVNVTPAQFSFIGNTANPPAAQSLNIQNTGGGALNIVSITAADKWVTIGTYPASLAAGPPTPVTVTADPTGFNPGYYQSSITVAASAGSATIPVTLNVAASAMTVSPAGMQFNMSAGGALGNPNGSFTVAFAGTTASFTAAVLPGASWLSISGQTTSSVSYAISATAAANLAAGSYYGTIRVTAGGAVNSPQDFQVILTVAPPSSPTLPDPEPAGLLFISNGSTTPASQTLALYASSVNPVNYQAAATTADGDTWLSVTPTLGSTSASKPGAPTVSVNPSGLTAGVYRGGVTYEYNGVSVRTVNVTLIVQAASTTASQAGSARPLVSPAAACAPSQLVISPTGLASNFSAPVSWPSFIAANLVDNCGTAVPNAQVSATFSNGDPPLPFTLVSASTGMYAATWTPRGTAAQVSIIATAAAPGFAKAMAQINGQVKPNTAPAINPGSVLQIFDPAVGGALAPGNVIQVYGTGFAAQTGIPSLPLPTGVSGTSLIIGGMPAPLFYVSSGQIDAQIPYELPGGKQYQVIVSANGALSAPVAVQVNAVAPGVLPYPNTTELVALRLDGSLVSDSSPAKPGDQLFFFVAGMGVTDNSAVGDGTGSPGLSAGDMLAHPQSAPTLTIDGAPVPVSFAGLTPGLVGLYQINFQLPANTKNGYSEFILTQNGTVSNSTLLPVHN